MAKTILIGAGNVGRRTADLLAAANHQDKVIVLDPTDKDFKSKLEAIRNDGYIVARNDLTARPNLREIDIQKIPVMENGYESHGMNRFVGKHHNSRQVSREAKRKKNKAQRKSRRKNRK